MFAQLRLPSLKLLLPLFVALIIQPMLSATAFASGGSKVEEDPNAVKYMDLYPNLVTNYLRVDGKIGFLSVGIQLKTKGKENFDFLWQHRFLLQDTTLWILRGQTEEQVKSFEHREQLRAELMQKVNELIEHDLHKKELVMEVLFSKYLWQ